MKSYFVIKVLAVIMGIGLTLYAWLLAYSYYTPVCLPETTNIAGFRYQMYFDDLCKERDHAYFRISRLSVSIQIWKFIFMGVATHL